MQIGIGIGIPMSALAGGGAAFSPDSAFFAGRAGFAFDFTDTSKLYQLSNGTTAVTADGDPIGYVTDLSGNGKHGTQATGANRPLYSAGKSVFDGSNDTLVTPSIDLTGTDKISVIVAVKRTGTGNHGLLSNGSTSAGTFNVGWFSSNSGWRASLYGSTGNTQIVFNETATPIEVLTFQLDIAGALAADEVVIRKNGDAVTTFVAAAGPAGGGNLVNAAMVIGNWLSAYKFNGDIYRMVVIAGGITTDERYQATRWCGEGCGLTILTEAPPVGDAGVNHFFTYGQSLSVGTQSRPAVSTVANDHYMFTGTGGVRAWDSASPYTAFVGHYELDSAAELMGETPCYGAYQIIEEVQGYSNKFLASAPGFGAVTIADLSTGGGYYTRLLNDVTNGRKLARAEGKHYKVRAYMWMQGESDGANATYAADLNDFHVQLNTDIKARTFQTDDVWMLSYQLARAKIGLAHLEASDTYDRIRVAMPMYHIPTTDGVHLTAASSKIAGAYFGLAYKAIILDGDETWQPLKCTGSSVAGTTIDLTYNRTGLEFDTTIVSAQTNQGFAVLDAGLTPLTVSSVTIVGDSTVRIVVASGTPAHVYYGFDDPTDHTANIAKGNLRDSQGDAIVFDGDGLDYPMHNWAVLQSIAL